LDGYNAACVSELQGRYGEAANRGNSASAANTAGVATVAGLVTAYTAGFGVVNPIGSTVRLQLTKYGFASLVAPAAAQSVGIAVGYNAATGVTITTALTTRNNLVGIGSAPQGLAGSNLTLPTAPTLQTILGTVGTVAATAIAPTEFVGDLEGSVILPPGAYAVFFVSTVSGAAANWMSMSWLELPI
jgi:hypothetical protein